MGDSDAEVLVFHGAFAGIVDEARRSLPSLRVLIQGDDGGGSPLLDGALAHEDVIAQHDPAPPIERSSDDALMLYTSGTTGLPKGSSGAMRRCSAQWRRSATRRWARRRGSR